MTTILLLVGSNLFMTYAWYGHLRTLRSPQGVRAQRNPMLPLRTAGA
jgi:uncharacterized protein (DUF486 family)